MVVLWITDKPNLQKVIMKKTLVQGAITILLFFSLFFSISQIDWVSIFKIKMKTDATEEKVGNLFWDIFEKSEKECKNKRVIGSVDSICNLICSANHIDRKKIKIHVVYKDEVNAFALPNGHLVIYSGLIMNTENEEELAGVMCHEIGHIELNHVMKKLIKETGLSVLISMTSGNVSSEVIKKAIKSITSSAFDRSLEKEADIKAVDYLVNAKINPEPFEIGRAHV